MSYKTVIDVTGVELTPFHPDICKGNGSTKDEHGNIIECCCDECDYLIGCLEASAESSRETIEKLL